MLREQMLKSIRFLRKLQRIRQTWEILPDTISICCIYIHIKYGRTLYRAVRRVCMNLMYTVGWFNCSTLPFKHLCNACENSSSSYNNNCTREKLFENFKLYFSWQSLDICLFYYQPEKEKKSSREYYFIRSKSFRYKHVYRVISDTKEAGSRHISEYCWKHGKSEWKVKRKQSEREMILLFTSSTFN